MRRLARTLVRDDAQADDVVQDAVVAAMRAPPRDPVALPAWLASAVRNGARQLWRGEGRRAARETAAARAEASPGAAEVVARAEEHGIVVQAVLALDEPYRSALLLRFYDDLPPREVAARLGVPVETARARIRRGVERLRERLDARHGGDGKAWRVALMPLVLHKVAAATAGGSATGAAAGHQLTTGAMVMASSGSVAAVGALALVVGVAGGWWFGATSSDAVAAKHLATIDEMKEQLQAATLRAAEKEQSAKREGAQSAGLEAKLAEAKHDLAEKQKALDAANEEIAQLKAGAAAPVAATPEKKKPRFEFAEFAKINDVDWKSVGEHLNAMSPICNDIVNAMRKGEDVLPHAGKAQQHNGHLINAAAKIVGQVPGTGVNGAFTHPAFQVNAIAAALDAAKKPLTPEQATALEKLARELAAEDAQRLLGYKDGTFALQKVLEEADLRARFFDGAFKLLAEDQRNTLSPPATRGLIGLDLYSEGLLWATAMRPVAFKETDREELVTDVWNILNTRMKLPAEQQDAARAVVAKWVADLPVAFVSSGPKDDADLEGVMPVSFVRTGAVQTLTLLHRLAVDLKLEGAPAEAVKKWPAAIVPTAKKGD
jgi:RNA polymerase sigma factor (sigma-70 family)